MLENLHKVLQEEVAAAVQRVASMEEKWTEADMVKRIVRYIYKSAGSSELLSIPWREACHKFFQSAMGSYMGGCQDKPWFYDIELAPAFARAAWEMLQASRAGQRASYDEVCDFTDETYQHWMDETLRNQAIWMTVQAVFESDKSRDKVFNALKKTYQGALDSAMEGQRFTDDLDRLRSFLERWMEDSLARSWNALQNEESEAVNEASGTKLFQKLMVPFGKDHPFSCVPAILTEHIGRPPPNWKFIGQQVRAIFKKWNGPEFNGSKNKRRRKGGAGGDAAFEEDDGAFDAFSGGGSAGSAARGAGGAAAAAAASRGARGGRAAAAWRGKEEEDAEAADDLDEDRSAGGGGHPRCTSEEDCQGSPSDVLIRHVLHGKDGDVYCASCWESFLRENPQLEGVELP